jgi:CheY-like chemotaxis protein
MEEKSMAEHQKTSEYARETAKKPTILIVEDDDPSRFFIKIVVRTLSKSIIEAKTGVEAVELCRKYDDIDLVLMDIQMPDMDGYEATRRIRSFNKEIIIIAQTAFGLSGDREKALEAGCNDYIPKPINNEALVALIKSYYPL